MTYRAATSTGMGFSLPVIAVCAKPVNPTHTQRDEQGYAGRLPEAIWQL